MPIRLESSGFYEWLDRPDQVAMLGVSSDRLSECVTYARELFFRGLFGHRGFGFTGDNLDFLSELPATTHLWMWDVHLVDINGLYCLPNIEFLGVNPRRPGIDFSRLRQLRTLTNEWIKDDHGLSRSAVSRYHLWHYKPKSKSFDGLDLPLNAHEIEFNCANPESLDGLPVMPHLKRLSFHRCRNLRDLTNLPLIAPNLESFSTTTCTHLTVQSGLQDHPTLQHAAINGKAVPLRTLSAGQG